MILGLLLALNFQVDNLYYSKIDKPAQATKISQII